MLINTLITNKKLKHRDTGSFIKHHNSNSLTIMILAIIAVCFSLFIWEHIALNNNLFLKPTYFIDAITSVCEKIFKSCGIIFAYIGSYYFCLHLENLCETVMSFYRSFFALITSIKYFKSGFRSVAILYGNQNVLLFTSWITLSTIFIICDRIGIIKYVIITINSTSFRWTC